MVWISVSQGVGVDPVLMKRRCVDCRAQIGLKIITHTVSHFFELRLEINVCNLHLWKLGTLQKVRLWKSSFLGRRGPSPNLISSARKSQVQKQQKESITWCMGLLPFASKACDTGRHLQECSGPGPESATRSVSDFGHLPRSAPKSAFGVLCGAQNYSKPREASTLIFKIRSCTARTDLRNKTFSADSCLFLRSDLTVQGRILKIRVLTSQEKKSTPALSGPGP